LLHGGKNERMIRIGQAPSSPDGDGIKPWAVPSSFGRRYPPNGGRRGIFFVFVCARRVLRSCAEFEGIGVARRLLLGGDSTNRRLRNCLIALPWPEPLHPAWLSRGTVRRWLGSIIWW